MGLSSAGAIIAILPRALISPRSARRAFTSRSEEHTSELQSLRHLVCRLLLEKNKVQLASMQIQNQAIFRCSAAKRAPRKMGINCFFTRKAKAVTSPFPLQNNFQT